MSEISRLETRLAEVDEQIQAHRMHMEENPDDATYQVALSSLEDHRNEITEKLRQAKKARKKEIVTYSLQGEIAQKGGLPLGVLGDLAKELERQVYAAAYYIRDGKLLLSRVPKTLRKEVNLQLAGIEPGSTKLLVSGDLQPDLFGHSVFEDSIKWTFELLHAEDSHEISEYAAEVGSMSAEKLRKFLDIVRKNDLSIDIEWASPSDKVYTWEADTKELDALTRNLDQIEEEDTRQIQVKGRITMMDSFGRFRIEREDGETYDCKYPATMHEKMTDFHLEQHVSASLWRHLIRNSATGHKKVSYRLQEIEDREES